jgi:hypothetical protein
MSSPFFDEADLLSSSNGAQSACQRSSGRAALNETIFQLLRKNRSGDLQFCEQAQARRDV